MHPSPNHFPSLCLSHLLLVLATLGRTNCLHLILYIGNALFLSPEPCSCWIPIALSILFPLTSLPSRGKLNVTTSSKLSQLYPSAMPLCSVCPSCVKFGTPQIIAYNHSVQGIPVSLSIHCVLFKIRTGVISLLC